MVNKTKFVKDCILIPAVSADENTNIIEVSKKLSHAQERRIFILNKNKSPIGIISIVDINDRVVAKGLDLKKIKAKDVMSYPLSLVVEVNEPLEEVKKKMIARDNYYCPVVKKSILVGLLSYSNLIRGLENGKGN